MLQRAASIHPLVEFLSTCALIHDHRINLVAYCSTCARQNVPEKVTNTAIVLEFRFCLSGENRVLPFPSFFFQVLFHFVLSTGQLVIACTARHLTFSSSCWITKAVKHRANFIHFSGWNQISPLNRNHKNMSLSCAVDFFILTCPLFIQNIDSTSRILIYEKIK